MQLSGMIVGLGNPGQEYAMTRHNFGFMLVDALLNYARDARFGPVEKISSPKDKLELWKAWLAPRPANPWLLMKPLTFMNLSGQAVRPVLDYYDIPVETLIVLHDEMDLPLGRMRFKFGGSSAGHNGIKNLVQNLGTQDFYRLRLGIGKRPGDNAIGHVMGRFSKAEENILEQLISSAGEALVRFPDVGFVATQEAINGFKLLEEQVEHSPK